MSIHKNQKLSPEGTEDWVKLSDTAIKASKSSNRLKNFSLVYIGGIILGMGIGFWLIKNPSENTNILLFEGLIHMIILVILGYRFRTPYQQISAGNKIQTAGYLHTLIGFTVTIGLMGVIKEENLEIRSLLPPLSSALYTSIIGWLFGGEIAAKGEEDNPSLEKITSEIVLILQEYGRKIEEIHSKQISQFKKYHQDLENYLDHLTGLYKALENKTQKLSTNLSELSNNTDQISYDMSETARSAKNIATSADETAEYLQNTRILIEQLEELTKYVNKQRNHRP